MNNLIFNQITKNIEEIYQNTENNDKANDIRLAPLNLLKNKLEKNLNISLEIKGNCNEEDYAYYEIYHTFQQKYRLSLGFDNEWYCGIYVENEHDLQELKDKLNEIKDKTNFPINQAAPKDKKGWSILNYPNSLDELYYHFIELAKVMNDLEK